ncbi:MAG: DUF1178 family protein [Rhodospirillales bacterium]|nr:MAG: DUF1178 family protein [Rhodospirillales bacterium]
MILYKLRCSGDHLFEAWFKDSVTYDEQAASGAIACPDCGDTAVAKAPMAPRIARARGDGVRVPADGAAAGGEAGGGETSAGSGAGPNAAMSARTFAHARSAEMRKALAELRRKVEETCDYVGPEFAEEARKIHYGETDERNIYGEATDDEAEELADEGIKVGRIPWLPRTDS